MIFFLRYRLVPAAAHPEHAVLGEAWACCWIKRRALADADRVARRSIRKQHWRILERECGVKATAADYTDNDESLDHYQQALIDQEVIVYHLSPRNPVYWVTYSVTQDDSAGVEAHYFLSGDSILREGEDLFSPDFWTGELVQTALEGARAAIQEAGWVALSLRGQRPCGRADLPDDLTFYYDEAEDAGTCLVFVHDRITAPTAPAG